MRWTKEPEEPPKFSDWTISLVRLGSDDQDDDTFFAPSKKLVFTYHVHRVLLAERMHYFDRIFSSSAVSSVSFLESKTRHSEINVPHTIGDYQFEGTRDAFEILLNYCYSKGPGKPMSIRTLVALWYLVDYLQFTGDFNTGQSLHETLEYWTMGVLQKYPISRGPGVAYSAVEAFREAGLNHLEQVQSLIAKFCVTNGPRSMDKYAFIMDVADVSFWMDIASFLSDKNITATAAAEWNENMAYFLRFYEFFEDDLPFDLIEAVGFLELFDKWQLATTVEGNRGDNKMTEFEEECINFLAEAGGLERPENRELKDRAIQAMSKPMMAMYLNLTLQRVSKRPRR